MKIFRIISIVLVLLIVLVGVVPVNAQEYDVRFEVVSTSPIGATIRVTVDQPLNNVEMVVLSLDDINDGILPQNCRQQSIKYTEINEIDEVEKEVKTPIMGERDALVSDYLIEEVPDSPIGELSDSQKKLNKDLGKFKPDEKIKDIKSDKKATSEILELKDKISDVIGYDTKIKKQEIKTEILKDKDKSAKQTFSVSQPMTFEATITSGDFYDGTWGSSGVLALIIDGEYYYDMGNSSWWSTAYAHRIPITIDSTNVDSDLSNYPVLLWLSSASGIGGVDVTAIFDELGANGLKIAVTNSTNTQQFYVEEVSWDSVGETAELWVNVDTVTSASDTTIYFYYDVTQADNNAFVGVTGSVPAESVWDANFVAVYHMNDNPDTSHIMDSTTNDYDGTKKGANEPIEAVGIIGEAQYYDNVNDYISTTAPNLGTSSFTLESIVNNDAVGGTDFIISKALAAGTFAGYSIYLQAATKKLEFGVVEDATTAKFRSRLGNTVFLSSTNYYVGQTWNPVDDIHGYVNGIEETYAVNSGSVSSWNTNNAASFQIGSRNNTLLWDGLIDEVRVSNTSRPTYYMKANQYNFTDALITYGAEQSIAVPSVVTNAATDITAITATLNGEITSANLGDLTTRGFEWDINSGAPYTNDWNEAWTAIGAYSHGIVGLTPSTDYYFRAYAVNQAGTGYGAELTFTTLVAIPLLPTNFVATPSGSDLIFTWTLGTYATSTIIVMSSSDYPTSLTDGTTIFNGAGVTYTLVDGYSESEQYYFSAWSENTAGYSVDYATTTAGGEAMTFWILLAIAGFFTVISLRYYNLLLSFLAMISWIGVWAYNLNNPPTGVTQGSLTYEILYYAFIVCAIVIMLLYFRNRGKAQGMFNANTENEGVKDNAAATRNRGIMELDTDEYRRLMRARIQNRRRNR